MDGASKPDLTPGGSAPPRWTAGRWSRGPVEWLDGGTAYISVVFSWDVDAAFSRACWHRQAGYEVRVGGPGVFTAKRAREFAGIAEVGGRIPDVQLRHNPMATKASEGCPVGCFFCIVPAMEGRTFTLLPDFEPRPVLTDNNLSALPGDYQQHIVDRYSAAGVPLLDANSGFEPKTFDEGVFSRWRAPRRRGRGCAPVSAVLDAALSYAARGWPVFPCNPKNKQPLLAAEKDADDKPIKGTGGLKKASTDPDQITAWWKKWPQALIGLACGHPTKGTETKAQPAGLCLFVLDFDPREDPDTGEVWTLDRLKRETEEQLGCALPVSMAALTPSDGVHLYLLKGDDGPSITNRGNLPEHVDVRGLGGYVIAPPSVMGPNAAKGQGGLRYRWHRREPIGGIAKAPERLLEVLRERQGQGLGRAAASRFPKSFTGDKQLPPSTTPCASTRWRRSTRNAGCSRRADGRSQQPDQRAQLRARPAGRRRSAGEAMVRSALQASSRASAAITRNAARRSTMAWSPAWRSPRDLSEIANKARRRAERGGSSHSSRSPRAAGRLDPPTPSTSTEGRQSSQTGGAVSKSKKGGAGAV
jgi:hypothetical protein